MINGVSPFDIIIEMSDFTCYFCGEQKYVFVPTEKLKKELRCSNCNAWLYDMNNQGAVEYNIRKFQETQY